MAAGYPESTTGRGVAARYRLVVREGVAARYRLVVRDGGELPGTQVVYGMGGAPRYPGSTKVLRDGGTSYLLPRYYGMGVPPTYLVVRDGGSTQGTS